MSYNITTGNWDVSDFMLKLKAEKKAANDFQLRRHDDWTENYDLYRNKVKTNRLTQRQAVNIPLMKETIKTILASIDDAPNVEWKETSGDEQKELIYQEVWNEKFKSGMYEMVDILDKKNVLIYGIGVKKLNIEKDGIGADALDPFDIIFDPLMTPGKVESCRFVVHQNIFKSAREILADERYTTEGKRELKIWVDSPPGITTSGVNKEKWEEKMKRLEDMGLSSKDFSVFAGGDRLIALTEHFTTIWNSSTKDWERRVVVYAEDTIELLNEKLEDLIGVPFWPFVVWNEDPETQDIYADSVGDLIRTPNKVLNVWYSQMIENRTLKNFQMHWFLPGQNYTPQTYTPGPGVMLPAPPGDDINKVIKPVEISGLDDTLTAINAITQIAERASGATAIEKGQPEQGTQTLGEVQVLVGKAMERTVGMAKFYRMAWYEFAWKWDKMMHKNAPKFIKLSKTGKDGKVFPKRVYAGDWKSETGYEPLVRSSSEQEQDSVKTLQKFAYVMAQHPENIALKKIGLSRQLESLDLTPEELKQVEEGAMQAQQMQQQVAPQGMPQQGQQIPQEADQSLVSDIENSLMQLQGT